MSRLKALKPLSRLTWQPIRYASSHSNFVLELGQGLVNVAVGCEAFIGVLFCFFKMPVDGRCGEVLPDVLLRVCTMPEQLFD